MVTINILQINDCDLPSRRFNGYDLNEHLRRLGHTAGQYVFQKDSEDADVHSFDFDTDLHRRLVAVEQAHSLHNLLIPYGQVLMQLPRFQQAELVHYHLIHNNILALPDFPALTLEKPTVWSWHDPWAVTGHCVHPKDCRGWESGCSPCPHLEEYFPLRQDRAGMLWNIKKQAYEQMDADIVVSSDFMMSFARNSPLGQCFSRVHQIPFGIHLEQFGQAAQAEARTRLKIPHDHFVIAFRNEKNPYKGIRYIEEMLQTWGDFTGVTILTSGNNSLPKKVASQFHCVELGWLSDTAALADFYTACDVFLMPSIAESFGLMAVEAMASARPVVCFEGTALPSVTFAPDCGIAVSEKSAALLGVAVKRMRECPEEARRRGKLGHRLAEQHYAFEDYVRRHMELYEEVIKRWEVRR